MSNLPTSAPLFLKVPRAAELLQMDPRTVRRGIEEGIIPAVKVGNAIRIPSTWVHSVAGLPEDSPAA